jgi:hypothetical protein
MRESPWIVNSRFIPSCLPNKIFLTSQSPRYTKIVLDQTFQLDVSTFTLIFFYQLSLTTIPSALTTEISTTMLKTLHTSMFPIFIRNIVNTLLAILFNKHLSSTFQLLINLITFIFKWLSLLSSPLPPFQG